jgi:hypothetical protein
MTGRRVGRRTDDRQSFDEFFCNGGYKPGDEPQAFVEWLAAKTGQPILGESESGEVVSALPSEREESDG